jgi:hypothetical protein
MSKFSIFTLFLSATIVVIVAELLVNEYIKYPEVQKNIAANVLSDSTGTVPGAAIKPGGTAAAATKAASAEIPAVPKSKITFELINTAGFTGVTLQVTPFNGILFESADLRDFNSVPVILNNLLLGNRQKIASFYEFKTGNSALSDEVYRLLKEKCGKLLGAIINNTDAFGEASFYVNYSDHPDSAFLVVKTHDTVYALTYQKDYHPLIRKLLWEITNN